MFYKRRLIRDGRQIAEKNKRQGLAFSKKLRDSAHWVPKVEFGLDDRAYNEICTSVPICISLGISPIFRQLYEIFERLGANP